MDIIQQLVSSLGINTEQAQGGLGLIMKMAQEKLSSGDFSSISAALPGAADLISSAPSSGASAGLGGLLGKVGSLLGSNAASGAGDLLALKDGFSNLNIDQGMIPGFISQVIAIAQQQGGNQVADLLKGFLPGGN